MIERAKTICVDCGALSEETTIERTSQIQYEGKLHEIHVSNLIAFKCPDCGSIALDNRADEQYRRALREKLRLLHPEQIKAVREQLSLTQERVARCLGIAAESLSRWENGHLIQSRSHDSLLRGFFELPEFRRLAASVRCAEYVPSTTLTATASWSPTAQGPELVRRQQDVIPGEIPPPNGDDTALAA